MKSHSGSLLTILLLILSMSAQANPPSQPPSAEAHAGPCSEDVRRTFDFWIGEWEVVGRQGRPLGTNVITSGGNGCWLKEEWRGAAGLFTGVSINTWDVAHGVWRQFWVGSDGIVLQLEGGWREGAMVLEGNAPAASGKTQRQRITWAPQADGSVTQHWESSVDGSENWTTNFFGIYRRRQ